MVKCGVFFAVRTELLNIISKSFNFKGLKSTELNRLIVSVNKLKKAKPNLKTFLQLNLNFGSITSSTPGVMV
jgi:hypothetical protein